MRTIKKVYYAAKHPRYNALEVGIGYDEGGYNYFTGKVDIRGYYVFITPCSVSFNDKYHTVQSGMFDGGKHLLQEAKRFSQKTAETFTLEHPEVLSAIGWVCEQYEVWLYVDPANGKNKILK